MYRNFDGHSTADCFYRLNLLCSSQTYYLHNRVT